MVRLQTAYQNPCPLSKLAVAQRHNKQCLLRLKHTYESCTCVRVWVGGTLRIICPIFRMYSRGNKSDWNKINQKYVWVLFPVKNQNESGPWQEKHLEMNATHPVCEVTDSELEPKRQRREKSKSEKKKKNAHTWDADSKVEMDCHRIRLTWTVWGGGEENKSLQFNRQLPCFPHFTLS